MALAMNYIFQHCWFGSKLPRTMLLRIKLLRVASKPNNRTALAKN